MEAVYVVTDEPAFSVTETGISLRAMDKSRVVMVDAEYPHTSLDAFTAPEQDGVVTVLLKDLLRILKLAKKDDIVTVVCNPEVMKLEITIKGATVSEFDLPLLDVIEQEVPPEPKVTYNVKIAVPTESLTEAFKKLEVATNYFVIETDKEKVVMTATGDLIKAKVELRKDESILELEVKEDSRACYSLDKLTEILKGTKDIGNVVAIEYAKDMPVKLDFTNVTGKLRYYLAPRIETE